MLKAIVMKLKQEFLCKDASGVPYIQGIVKGRDVFLWLVFVPQWIENAA